jgi:2-keto-3-deoxy-L-rhamnonate aldolase RhmA
VKTLRAALDAGGPVVGPGVFSGHPGTVELIGHLGFDFVLLDTEQAAPSSAGEDIAHLVRAADAARVPPTVRIGELSAHLINNTINTGAQGVWVPHVETADQARAMVSAARYPPIGRRGAAPVVRGGRYGVEPFDDYRARADRDTVLIAIVESVEGVERIDEIAAVDGLDVVCFGTFDFAVSLGLGQADFYGGGGADGVHPDVRAAGERVLAACRRTGTIPATAAWSPAAARLWLGLGFRMLLFGLDTALMLGALRDLRAQTDALKAELR